MACYGLEYFCFEGDGLWSCSDAELIALASRELQRSACHGRRVLGRCVVRQLKAYPVYDDDYADDGRDVREEFDERFPTFTLSAATACTSTTTRIMR